MDAGWKYEDQEHQRSHKDDASPPKHYRSALRSRFVVFCSWRFSASTCFEISSNSFFASAPAFANWWALRSALPTAVPILTATCVNLLFLAIVLPQYQRQPSYTLRSRTVNATKQGKANVGGASARPFFGARVKTKNTAAPAARPSRVRTRLTRHRRAPRTSPDPPQSLVSHRCEPCLSFRFAGNSAPEPPAFADPAFAANPPIVQP